MKAAVLTAYGPAEGLQVQEVAKPTPKPGEVLVRVHTTTVTAGDAEPCGLALPWMFWCLRSVKANGGYVRGAVPGLWELAQALWTRITSRKRVVLGDAGESVEDLVLLAGLLEEALDVASSPSPTGAAVIAVLPCGATQPSCSQSRTVL